MSNTVVTRGGRVEGLEQDGLLVFKGHPFCRRSGRRAAMDAAGEAGILERHS